MIIGQINIQHAVLLAPMEDVTDISFRLVCKRLGADIVYTEFVNSEGLVRNSEKTKRKMMFLEEERPFGIQLYGGSECSMESAAKMAEELQPDLIDINCGCWVKNVVGQGAGSGLLKDLAKMRSVIASVVKSVNIPVTVKTRLGWDEKSIQIDEVARMVEDCGAKSLTIHCRTRSQGNKGEVDYSWIPVVKRAVSIPIIVNGGIDSAQKAHSVFIETGCDGIMIASGAIYNPWIFREIKHYLHTGELLSPPSLEDRIALLQEHLNHSVQLKGERQGVIEFRKYYSGYLRGYSGVSRLRAELMKYVEQQPVIDTLDRFAENKTEAEALLV
ncbi:MAG: tRNA dihydrouridine synthase DusB [Bacteroidetes bacterium]|nr:MAG: tRNA dihydrouridine synthase DusB [Bacteroidota bacterium]